VELTVSNKWLSCLTSVSVHQALSVKELVVDQKLNFAIETYIVQVRSKSTTLFSFFTLYTVVHIHFLYIFAIESNCCNIGLDKFLSRISLNCHTKL